jgi:hypothetical protein
VAQQALNAELAGLSTLFSGIQSLGCESDLADVGVTNSQIAAAASSTNILDGLTSTANYAQAIYGNSLAYGAAAFYWGGVTVGMFMSINQSSGTAAVSQAPGNNIYISSGWVNGMTANQQEALLLHELLHNITGKTDDVLQGALGLSVGAPSQNIADKLGQDCLK